MNLGEILNLSWGIFPFPVSNLNGIRKVTHRYMFPSVHRFYTHVDIGIGMIRTCWRIFLVRRCLWGYHTRSRQYTSYLQNWLKYVKASVNLSLVLWEFGIKSQCGIRSLCTIFYIELSYKPINARPFFNPLVNWGKLSRSNSSPKKRKKKRKENRHRNKQPTKQRIKQTTNNQINKTNYSIKSSNI